MKNAVAQPRQNLCGVLKMKPIESDQILGGTNSDLCQNFGPMMRIFGEKNIFLNFVPGHFGMIPDDFGDEKSCFQMPEQAKNQRKIQKIN